MDNPRAVAHIARIYIPTTQRAQRRTCSQGGAVLARDESGGRLGPATLWIGQIFIVAGGREPTQVRMVRGRSGASCLLQ